MSAEVEQLILKLLEEQRNDTKQMVLRMGAFESRLSVLNTKVAWISGGIALIVTAVVQIVGQYFFR